MEVYQIYTLYTLNLTTLCVNYINKAGGKREAGGKLICTILMWVWDECKVTNSALSKKQTDNVYNCQ